MCTCTSHSEDHTRVSVWQTTPLPLSFLLITEPWVYKGGNVPSLRESSMSALRQSWLFDSLLIIICGWEWEADNETEVWSMRCKGKSLCRLLRKIFLPVKRGTWTRKILLLLHPSSLLLNAGKTLLLEPWQPSYNHKVTSLKWNLTHWMAEGNKG